MRAHTLVLHCLVVASLGPLPPRPQGSADPFQKLSVFLGEWDVQDTYHPIEGRPTTESGVRTCTLVLRERYVECVTRARNEAGREREYRWLINYNSDAGHYELTAIFSNIPTRVSNTLKVDPTGGTWHVRYPPYSAGGVTQWTGAELRFEGSDRAVWTSYRNVDTTSVTSWIVSSRETWARRR